MQLLGRLEIKSKEKLIEFLNHQETGRICSIDKDGYPQIIPMNFVYINDVVYMHSHTKGEKLENIKQNSKVGFEVDQSIDFLPSYFTHPTDASQAEKHLKKRSRLKLAKKILERNSPTAQNTLKLMGISQAKDGLVISEEPS